MNLVKRLRYRATKWSPTQGPVELTLAEAADRIEQLEAALREIADQDLEGEMDDYDNADFEGAYDCIVRRARAALETKP
jgi:hypothetical protein